MKARWLALFFLIGFGALSLAEGLFPCPDCERPVSYRAIMCPQCGSPGAAIQEAFEALKAKEEGPPPVPVIRMVSEHARTVAVAMAFDDAPYVVADLWAVGNTTQLAFQSIFDGEAIAYRSMQIARDAPLVRFRTDSPNLLYLQPSAKPTEQTVAWLSAEGIIADGEPLPGAVSLLNADHRILSLILRENGEAVRYPVPLPDEWIDAAPREFRDQMTLLMGALAAADGLSDKDRNSLRQKQWLSPFLKRTAQNLTDKQKETTQ